MAEGFAAALACTEDGAELAEALDVVIGRNIRARYSFLLLPARVFGPFTPHSSIDDFSPYPLRMGKSPCTQVR
ncbi:MAG TPA: hypothetical protein VNQ74_13710 [Burkholderiaceae bacterium]|nr:hypothetical protein [Burkholderiaceae bacterium]